jgi:hypothetical protein
MVGERWKMVRDLSSEGEARQALVQLTRQPRLKATQSTTKSPPAPMADLGPGEPLSDGTPLVTERP